MNCFNGEKYLREALDSILAQKYQNWELIFWDNQSTDKSAEIFQSYTDARFNYYFANTFTQLSAARNCAIENSKGEYLAFLDVDDWWDATKLSKQIPLFDDQDVGLVYSSFWKVNEIKNTKSIVSEKLLPTGHILDHVILSALGLLTIVIRRAAYDSLQHGFDERYNVSGDHDISVRIAINWKIMCVQEPIAFYRWHGANDSISSHERSVKESLFWIESNRLNPIFSSNASFIKRIDVTNYMNGLYMIETGEVKDVMKSLLKLRSVKLIIKLLFLLLFPKNYLKNRRRVN
jgi:glycosyltransferase involved in cell wall biosynthesis